MSEHPAKAIDFRPHLPRNLDFGIGLIGCGGITEHHLQAYQDAGWKVHGLCDKRLEAARHRQQQYFPNARVMMITGNCCETIASTWSISRLIHRNVRPSSESAYWLESMC